MNWTTPNYQDRRFGFEVTMYIYAKTNIEPNQRQSIRQTDLPHHSSHSWLRGTLSLILPLALLGLALPSFASSDKNWLLSGGNLENTRYSKDTSISPTTVNNLTLSWKFFTQPDVAPNTRNFGAVGVTPAIEGNYIYFTDFAGNLYKNRRDTGANIWKKNLFTDLSLPGKVISQSRNTPLVLGDLLILGNNFYIADPLCASRTVPTNPQPFICQSGDGAIVIAVNKYTGNLVWSKKVDNHFMAKITGSLSGFGNKVFVGVSSWEEDAARGYPDVTKLADGSFVFGPPPYKCCSFRGSVVALDAKSGNILWKTYLSPGLDANNQLSQALHQLLTKRTDGSPDRGFFGISAYGHSPTIDKDRGLVYVGTSQNETAPEAAELCEKYRRNQLGLRTDLYGPVGSVPNPDLSPRFINAGVTCANLNQKLKNYQSAVLALDINSGKVKWSFQPRPYDAFIHSCTPPVFVGLSDIAPTGLVPLISTLNCFQDPIGPDYGFGHNPLLLKDVRIQGDDRDLLVAGNKDGRVFAINPNNGKQIWVQNIDPGSVFGGVQYGMASDGKSIFTGTANRMNAGRDRNDAFESSETFMTRNGLGNSVLAYPLYYGLNEKPGAPSDLLEIPGPASFRLPFVSPSMAGLPGYPITPLMTGPGSGPRELYQVTNMPSDMVPDNVNVWLDSQGKLQTTAGMVHSLDAATGRINWERPAIDSVAGRLLPVNVFGSVTVANGVVFAGYYDKLGTLVGLDAKTGERLFIYQNTTTYPDPSNPSIMKTVNIGGNEAGPAVVGGCVYWGMGAHTTGIIGMPSRSLPEFGFANSTLTIVFPNSGNSVIAFCLPGGSSGDDD